MGNIVKLINGRIYRVNSIYQITYGKEKKMGQRQIRSDCTVGTLEKKAGLPPGTIRNKNGRDARSDKKIGTIRKENEKK